MAESLTQKWLRQNIQIYPNSDTVYLHVDAALLQFPSLRPKTDVYTYDDGRTQLLLCLHGLLPISYRSTPYHIPIALWITREYPRMPPIAYVVPTSDMLVRPGRHMDLSGKCQIEYIQAWQRKNEGCNISALFENMQDHFSREPPVYAKPKSSASSPPSLSSRPEGTSPNYSERPPPPLPGARTISPTMHHRPTPPTILSHEDRPPVPLKPGSSNVVQDVRVQLPGFSMTANSSERLSFLPMQPPTAIGTPQRKSSPVPPKYDPDDPSPWLSSRELVHPYGSAWSPDPRMRPPPALPAAVHSRQAQLSSVVASPSPVQSPPPPPPPPIPPIDPAAVKHTTYNQAPHAALPRATQSSQHTIHHTIPIIQPVSPSNLQALPVTLPPPDLLDNDDLTAFAAEPTAELPSAMPAPPRPPNPELLHLHSQVHAKLASEFDSLTRVMRVDAERLRTTQADLLAGEPAVRDEMARLEAVRDVCRSVASRLRVVVEAAERNTFELKRKGDPEVDELVCSTTIVHNQLINLVAEDNAIEDTMYHLHRALNVGRIDLEKFLKTTRVLAEEQFMKRALIEKILNAIPMGPDYH